MEFQQGCPRKIIHVDMDAFYASVEQRDNPGLRGKLMAVGAKLASDYRKPDGLFVITPEMGPSFVEALPNRVRKSVGAESTFLQDLTSLDDMRAELGPLLDKVWHYRRTTGVRGRTVTIKVKFADFHL